MVAAKTGSSAILLRRARAENRKPGELRMRIGAIGVWKRKSTGDRIIIQDTVPGRSFLLKHSTVGDASRRHRLLPVVRVTSDEIAGSRGQGIHCLRFCLVADQRRKSLDVANKIPRQQVFATPRSGQSSLRKHLDGFADQAAAEVVRSRRRNFAIPGQVNCTIVYNTAKGRYVFVLH